MSARTTRLLLDVTWDPDTEDKPTTWQWGIGYDPRPAHLQAVVVGEVTGRDDEVVEVPATEWRALVHAVEQDTRPDEWFFGNSPIIAARNLVRAMAADDDGCDIDGRTGFCRRDHECPEPPDLDGEDLFPARPVSHRDAITDLTMEATRD